MKTFGIIVAIFSAAILCLSPFDSQKASACPEVFDVSTSSKHNLIEPEPKVDLDDVEKGLELQIENLRLEFGRSENRDSRKVNQIQRLIDTTEVLLIEYRERKNNQTIDNGHITDEVALPLSLSGTRDFYDNIIVNAISLFSLCGYVLSAELLTYARSGGLPEGQEFYVPIYGRRVYSSNVVYQIANGASGPYSFGKGDSNSRNENDLLYALRSFSVLPCADSTKHFFICDYYDFGGSYTINESVLDDLQMMFDILEQMGYISTFPIRIEVDVRVPLRPSVVAEYSNYYSVTVHNYGDSAKLMYYNTKMANQSDAIDWQNLVDVDKMYVGSNQTKTLSIAKNGTATHISLSYIEGNDRVVSFGDGLSVSTSINFEPIVREVFTYTTTYSSLLLTRKNANKWYISLKNKTNAPYYVTWGTTMHTQGDAYAWHNISPYATTYLIGGNTTELEISDTGGSYASILIVNGTNREVICLGSLSPSGTMFISGYIDSVNNHLAIRNDGKTGSNWNITIINNANYAVNAYYNQKMCFRSDAQNWSGLSDIASVQIPSYSSATVQISTNWFADTVVCSKLLPTGERLVTYGYSLSTDGSMSIAYNTLSA